MAISPPQCLSSFKAIARCGSQAAVIAAAVAGFAGHSLANPQGGVVKKGEATIAGTPEAMTIRQSSDKAVIDWQSFGIGDGEGVVFTQPGTGAIALNRVTGNDASNILGSLRANGQVWLVNRNGILFGPKATVDVHGLVATTADIDDEQFMASNFQFANATPNPAAGIVNQGTITLSDRGLAALVAPSVRNEGVIRGRLGVVVVAGAPTFGLDLQGDRLLSFAVTSQVAQAAPGGGALVENTGEIRNDGGTVMLTAQAAAGVVDQAINTSGVIAAQGTALRGGNIILISDGDGAINVSGRLNAGPETPGARAGMLYVHGENVAVSGQAVIDPVSSIEISARDTVNVDTSMSAERDVALTAPDILIGGTLAAGDEVRLRGADVATVGVGKIAAARLDVASTASTRHPQGGGVLDLRTDTRELAIGTTRGADQFRTAGVHNDGDLRVSEIASSGISADTITLQTDGTLTLDQPIRTSGSGDAVVIVTGSFVNNAGPDALQTSGGRALVYSTDPQADTLGNIPAEVVYGDFSQAPPGSIALPGTVFIYQRNPNAPTPPPASTPSPPASLPNPSPPTVPALPSQEEQLPSLNNEEIVRITQPATIPTLGSVEARDPQAELQLIRLPPVATGQTSETQDLLFANECSKAIRHMPSR